MRMVRWMCGVKLKDRLRSKELRERLGIDDSFGIAASVVVLGLGPWPSGVLDDKF